MISISLSPNVEKDDRRLALKTLFSPFSWKKGKAIGELENDFREYLEVSHAFAFNSGRSSLMAISNAIGGEIILQSFTCNATINPVRWSGSVPVLADVDDNYNMDVDDLKRKITKNTKAVMVQHTFGLPARIDEIKQVCRENNLLLIEDCAHSLGADYGGQKVGAFGDISFFSFSRDKVISSVYGGLVTTNNQELAQKIKKYQHSLEYPGFWWINQQVTHPLALAWIMPIYSFGGKYILRAFQLSRILSKAVHYKEKRGEKPSYFPKKMPNALAILARHQFKKLEYFNNHRRKIAKIYTEKLIGFKLPEAPTQSNPIYLRFPVRHKKAHQIIMDLRKENILIGDWYTSPIAPGDTKMEYFKDLDIPKNSQKLAQTTLNLPTHINISEEIANLIVGKINRMA